MVSIDIIASNNAQNPNMREVRRGKSHKIMDLENTRTKDAKSSVLDHLQSDDKKSN